MDMVWSVSEFIAVFNQTLETAYPRVNIQGEVSDFKEWRQQLAFFDLKDESGAINCMVPLSSLSTPLEEGMQVQVIGKARLTNKGRFSITVHAVIPQGEGALQRAFELLKAKLEQEGLFDEERKRSLPDYPELVAVITAGQSAAWADFQKIARERWPYAQLQLHDVQVQGTNAPEHIVHAFTKLNASAQLPDIVAIIRGGGSLEDLMSFNDERVIRAVAQSRIPVVSGVGHESDVTLIDYVSDVRASTPTNAAQLLFPDINDVRRHLTDTHEFMHQTVSRGIEQQRQATRNMLGVLERLGGTAHMHEQLTIQKTFLAHTMNMRLSESRRSARSLHSVLSSLDPRAVLKRGYAIARVGSKLANSASITVGDTLSVELVRDVITSEVTHVETKS